jgi:hypothetical protein
VKNLWIAAIGLMAALVLGPAVQAQSAAGGAPSDKAASEKPMLIHHALFWLKSPGSSADRDQLIAGLETLRDIGAIRRLHIGVPASTEQRDVVDASYDVSELMFFDSVEDQKAYQDHPIHKAFVAKYAHLWDRVVVYDALDVR